MILSHIFVSLGARMSLKLITKLPRTCKYVLYLLKFHLKDKMIDLSHFRCIVKRYLIQITFIYYLTRS
jgi:hypothetical protein